MLPTTEPGIDEFLDAFETGTLPKARWTHAAHLFTAACYVHMLGEAAAVEHMRRAIPRYNEAVGGKNTESSGYHETVTIFWVKLLAHFYRTHAVQRPQRVAFATLAVDRFAGDRGLLARYYRDDIVTSTEARRTWLPPTLQAIDSPLDEPVPDHGR